MLKYRAYFLIALSLLFVGALLLRQNRQRQKDRECRELLKYVGNGILGYENLHGRFPAPREGGHSWRIRLVPHLFASAMFGEYNFDEAWNSDNNLSIDSRPIPTKNGGAAKPHGMPYVYSFEPDKAFHPEKYDLHCTRFLMFVGDNAFAAPQGSRTKADLLDDPSTILVAGETHVDQIHWLAPQDFDAEDLQELFKTLGSCDGLHPAVLFADGAVYRISPKVTLDLLRAMLTIDGGEQIDRNELIVNGILH